ncbi:MAG: hypothetical protein M1838_001591 [Thelocarpon superellum]|nr:MAG: hypothetical protein M1838_001591 [Thelocarpon superellum]
MSDRTAEPSRYARASHTPQHIDLPYRQLYGNVPLSDPFVAAISTTLGPGGSYGGIFQAFLGLHVRHARSMSATVETLSLWLRELRDPTVDAGESANDKCLIVPSNARIEETSGGESARGNTSRSSSSALDMKQNEQQEAQQPNEIMARCTSRLNEHHAKTGASLKYLEFDVGSPLAPSFHVECHVDDAIFVGAGRNKKEAKHRASKEACARLGI